MVSLPDSHVFELLARFPSTTYKIIEREFTPQNPPSTGYYSTNQNIRFNLSAAVNEFVLVDSSNLEACVTTQVQGSGDFGTLRSSKYRPAWRPGPSWISSVRETVNSGSLTTYENTDKNTCNWFNTMRGALSRSPVVARQGFGTYALANPAQGSSFPWNDASATPDADYIDIQYLTKAGFCNRSKRIKGISVRPTGTTAGNNFAFDTALINGLKLQSVPLTGLGSIFQSNSIVPLGLFSTYSGQSYGLEIVVAGPEKCISAPAAAYSDATNIYVARPRISVKILKILDETVMEAVLQLYNKSQSIEVVDNMKIPMSLQMNSLKYTYHQYSLNPGAQEYTINIPCTAASLRGFAFRVVKSSLIANMSSDPQGQVTGLPLADDSASLTQAIVYKFQVKIGSECIMESAVEQESIVIGADTFSVNPCLNFFAKQAKKSGHLFSLLHHSRQAKDDCTGLEDITMDGTAPMDNTNYQEYIQPGYMYSMNLENINHFENNNQSSGIDMRNYGSYYLTLRVGSLDATAFAGGGNRGNQLAALVPLTVQYTLLLMNAEDVVYEVSRSGVADISSNVL